MGLTIKDENKTITKCCDTRQLLKEYMEKNLNSFGAGKIYTSIELLYKATYKANCEECNKWYSEIEKRQIELMRESEQG